MADDDLDTRVAALCAAPVGCLFLLTVEASGLDPEEAVRPEVALQISTRVDHDATPWTGSQAAVLAWALGHGARLAPLARVLVSLPGAAWWWAPLERGAQLWTGASRVAPDGAGELVPKIGPPTDHERYALRPEWGMLTSTAYGDVSAHLAYLAWGPGDFPIENPIPCRRYAVSPLARVFEVHGPGDWGALVAAYPAMERGPARNEVPGDRPDQVVPDWAAVAGDWDGVHLSFGGLLTTRFVWVEGLSGPMRNWSWEIEGTHWLKWCFDGIEEDDPPVAETPPRDERIRGALY